MSFKNLKSVFSDIKKFASTAEKTTQDVIKPETKSMPISPDVKSIEQTNLSDMVSKFSIINPPQEVDNLNDERYPVIPGFNAEFNTPGNTFGDGDIGDSKFIDIVSEFQNRDTSIDPYNGTTVSFTTDTHAFGFTANLNALSDSQFVGVDGDTHTPTTSYYDNIHTRNPLSDTFGGPVNFFDNSGADGFTKTDYSEGNFYTTQFKNITGDSFIKPNSIMDFDSWNVPLNTPFTMTFTNQTTGDTGVDLMAGFMVMGGFGLNLTGTSDTQFKGIAGGDDTSDWQPTTHYYDNVHKRNTISDKFPGPVDFLDNTGADGFTITGNNPVQSVIEQLYTTKFKNISADGTFTKPDSIMDFDSWTVAQGMVQGYSTITFDDQSTVGGLSGINYTSNSKMDGFGLNIGGSDTIDTFYLGIDGGDDTKTWEPTTDYYDSVHNRNPIQVTPFSAGGVTTSTDIVFQSVSFMDSEWIPRFVPFMYEMSDTNYNGLDTVASTFSIPEGSTFNYTDNYSINTDNVTDPFGDGSTAIPGGIENGTLFDPEEFTDNKYPLFENRQVTLLGGNIVDWTYNQFDVLYTDFQTVTENKYTGEQGQIMSLIGLEPEHPSVFLLMPGASGTLQRLYGGYTEPFIVSPIGSSGYGDRTNPKKAATDDLTRMQRFLASQSGAKFVENMNLAASDNKYAPWTYKPGSLLSGIPVLGENVRNRLDEGVLGGAMDSIIQFATGGESVYLKYPEDYVDFEISEGFAQMSKSYLKDEAWGNIGQFKKKVDGTEYGNDEWLQGITPNGEGKSPTFSTRYLSSGYSIVGKDGIKYPTAPVFGNLVNFRDVGDQGSLIQIHTNLSLGGFDSKYSGDSFYEKYLDGFSEKNYSKMFTFVNSVYNVDNSGDDILIDSAGFGVNSEDVGYHDSTSANKDNQARNLARLHQLTPFKSQLDEFGKGKIAIGGAEDDTNLASNASYLQGRISNLARDLTHSSVLGRTILGGANTSGEITTAELSDANTPEIERDKKKLRTLNRQFKNYSKLGFDKIDDIGDGSPVVDINYSQMLEITKESDDWPGSNGRQQQSMSPFERFGNVLPTFDTPEGEEAKPGHPLGDPFTLFGLGTHIKSENLDSNHNDHVLTEVDREIHGMPLYFKDLRDNRVLVFRAYISGLNESYSPSWESETYIGRSEPVYTYTGNEREVGFSLKLVSQTKDELDIIYVFLVLTNIKKISKNIYKNFITK